MRYEQLNLTTAQNLQLCNIACELSAYRTRIIYTHPDSLKIKFPDKELILHRAIDDWGPSDWINVYLIWGDSESSFLTVGGELVYKIDVLQKQAKELLEFRDSYFTGLWNLQMIEFENSLVVLGETDIMRIDNQLNILWHVSKGLDDVYLRQESKNLVFMWDYNETEWQLDLISGEKYGWMDGTDITL
jgi:hypothetical protein